MTGSRVYVSWCQTCEQSMVPTSSGFQCGNLACTDTDWHGECSLRVCGFDYDQTCGLREGMMML